MKGERATSRMLTHGTRSVNRKSELSAGGQQRRRALAFRSWRLLLCGPAWGASRDRRVHLAIELTEQHRTGDRYVQALDLAGSGIRRQRSASDSRSGETPFCSPPARRSSWR